ncbi:hypothetical protein [Rickettsia asembonensis]|uniref:hypothetical protein n=1 Tax=Rickettsia asembonensis TaxID=1068590 RepID=UPI001F517B49|nr:hypothetical protein [Rickettsia asembonensis]
MHGSKNLLDVIPAWHCCVDQFCLCHPSSLVAGSNKNTKIISIFIVFWIPWSSHGMTPNGFFGPCNKVAFN